MTEQVRRATRLVEIERRLRKRPGGLTVRELAEDLGYSPRTIQRDLNVLESELGIPLVAGDGRRWQLMPGSAPVGAVRFTLQEARAIFLATRLFLRHADELDPDGIGAMEKLSDALPTPLAKHMAAAVAELKQRPQDKRQIEVLRVLTDGWAQSQTVSIRYRSQAARAERKTDLDPYLLEPSATGAATYVIGFSHQHGAVRTFKVDRILAAQNTRQPFELAEVEDIRQRMALSWGGVVLGEDQYDIVLDFAPDVADRIAETHWHPSQRLTRLPDGGMRLELKLPSLLEFIPWVRSWGPAAVVVGPAELRDEVAASLEEAAAHYR